MSENHFRRIALAATLVSAAVLVGGGVSSAEPDSGSSGTNDAGSADTGIGPLDTGSAIGTQVLDFGSAVLGLPTWSSISSGSSGGFGQSPQQQPCNASTKAGHDGITETVHLLGRAGPTSFVLSYETENVPDLIDVFYQGGLVASTGWVGDNTNEGTGSIVVNLPPGNDTSVLVRVNGGVDTVWEYTVHCP